MCHFVATSCPNIHTYIKSSWIFLCRQSNLRSKFMSFNIQCIISLWFYVGSTNPALASMTHLLIQMKLKCNLQFIVFLFFKISPPSTRNTPGNKCMHRKWHLVNKRPNNSFKLIQKTRNFREMMSFLCRLQKTVQIDRRGKPGFIWTKNIMAWLFFW